MIPFVILRVKSLIVSDFLISDGIDFQITGPEYDRLSLNKLVFFFFFCLFFFVLEYKNYYSKRIFMKHLTQYLRATEKEF